jgi:hypothetical protein
MAKQKKNLAKGQGEGPFIATAVFCSDVLEGTDKTQSAIRIISQLNIALHPNAPEEVPSLKHPIPVQTKSLISFRTGNSRGPYELHLVIRSPSGVSMTFSKEPLPFGQEPFSGANLKSELTILVHEVGLYWVDVRINGKLLTSMPLQINVNRTAEPMPLVSLDQPIKAKGSKKLATSRT